MEFRANEGKSVTIEVGGKTYAPATPSRPISSR